MEITWHGLSCFRIAERGFAAVLTDPYGDGQAGAPKLEAGIVTLSHASPGQNHQEAVKGTPYVISGPGEYEVGGVFITGIQTGGQKGPDNTLYVFDFDSLTVAHLGNLESIPTQTEVEAIGTVNVALMPIGSKQGLTAAQAAEVIRLLEPNIVVPMQYAHPGDISLDTLDKFLKEMGLSEVEKRPSLKISGTPLSEETQVVVLNYQHV